MGIEGARERVGKRGGEGSEQIFRHLGVHTWYRGGETEACSDRRCGDAVRY